MLFNADFVIQNHYDEQNVRIRDLSHCLHESSLALLEVLKYSADHNLPIEIDWLDIEVMKNTLEMFHRIVTRAIDD